MVKRARAFSSSYGRGLLLLVVFGIVIGAAALSARQGPVIQRMPDWVSDPITPVLTMAAIDAPKAPEPPQGFEQENEDHRTYPRPGHELVPKEPPPPERDALLALQDDAARASNRTVQVPTNFDAQRYTGVNPADPSGAVGPSHFVQAINAATGTNVAIYNKSGALLAGPFLLSTLGSGGNCAVGSGDPVVLYDRLANRWLLSEFADVGNHMCVYISTSSDPTGTYYRYDFPTPTFPDYPKYAAWPNAYYVTSNEDHPAIYALDRTQMLSGGIATGQRFIATDLAGFDFQALTPADFDGTISPPASSPAYFMRHRDDEVHNAGANDPTRDFVEVWELTPNFVTPASSILSGPTNIGVTSFDSTLCGTTSFFCFAQPGSATTLDPLREVIMYRLQYRNHGSYASMVGNFVVDVTGSDLGGIRWFEMRKTGGGAWTLYQEGTWAPNLDNRWMGAVSMDGSGNILLAYSVSSSGLAPGLRFTGRAPSDLINTMSVTETAIANGTTANGSNRWGDYQEMTLDPADDCTFWFTGMYSPSSQWMTRIAKMKFDGCVAETPIITAAGSTITYGNYVPINSVADPGERVSVNLALVNNGAPTTNLYGLLDGTGGANLPNGSVSYGAVPTGGSATRPFRFTATGACGSLVTATMLLYDGSATPFSSVQFPFVLGTPVGGLVFGEAFDGVSVPALPAGWTTAATGAESPWVTTNVTPSSSINAAFAPNPGAIGSTELVTPPFAVPYGTTLLGFSNYYQTEPGFDGMVLEISINGGVFSDITAGGANPFITGGYTGTLPNVYGNPIGGRPAWSGNSGGYINSTINLPAAAAGQNVRLKWRVGTDNAIAAAGVRIDTIGISGNTSYTCGAVPQVFTDTPLTAGVTTVRGVHVIELRDRIDKQRLRFGLGGMGWTDFSLPPGTVLIRAQHVLEMRAGLAPIWALAGLPAPTYTDPSLAAGTIIRAAHINELRNAVKQLEDY